MAGLTSGVFKLMELKDCKIKVLTATDAPGATAVDVPGMMKLAISPKIDMKKLHGDSELKDVYSKVTEIELDIECSLASLDVLQVIQGGAVTNTPGTGDVTKKTYSMTADNTTPPYFFLEGQWTYVNQEAGDAHVILYKVKATDAPSFEINDASGNFGTLKFKALALPTSDQANEGKWYDVVLNQTKTAIV